MCFQPRSRFCPSKTKSIVFCLSLLFSLSFACNGFSQLSFSVFGDGERATEGRLIVSNAGQMVWVPNASSGDPMLRYVASRLKAAESKRYTEVQEIFEETVVKAGESSGLSRSDASQKLHEVLSESQVQELLEDYNSDVVRFYGVAATIRYQICDFSSERILPVHLLSDLEWLDSHRSKYWESSNKEYATAIKEIREILIDKEGKLPIEIADAIAYASTLKPQKELLHLQASVTPEKLPWLEAETEEFACNLINCFILPGVEEQELSFHSSLDGKAFRGSKRDSQLSNLKTQNIGLLGNEAMSDFLELTPVQQDDINKLVEDLRDHRKQLWRSIVSSNFSPNPVTAQDFEVYKNQNEVFFKRYLAVTKEYESDIDDILIGFQKQKLEMLYVRNEVKKIGIIASLLYGSLSKKDLLDDRTQGKLRRFAKALSSRLEKEIRSDAKRIEEAISERLKSQDGVSILERRSMRGNRSPWLLLNDKLY